MKNQNLYNWKLSLVFVILLLAGCSPIDRARITETPSLTPIVINAPTSIFTPAPTLLPFAGKIAFMYASNIFVINGDGSGLKNLTNNLLYNSNPAWSPDGQQIAYTSELHGVSNIYVMKADGSDQMQLTHADSWGPAWSPDGKYIIFNTNRDGVTVNPRGQGEVSVSEVYIMNSDGSEQKRLTNNQDSEGGLSWSPKGDVIAVLANAPDTYGYSSAEIYLMSLDGTISKNPIAFGDIDKPAWSPNGEFIAFTSTELGKSKLCTIKADGSNEVCLIKSVSPVFYSCPSWSPDGNHIVFSSTIDGYGNNLYIMNADGSNLTRLTNMPGDENAPAWSPVP